MARQRLIVPTMTGSSPISIQAEGEPAPIVPAAIQIPKAMIPIEIENENASFMMGLQRSMPARRTAVCQ